MSTGKQGCPRPLSAPKQRPQLPLLHAMIPLPPTPLTLSIFFKHLQNTVRAYPEAQLLLDTSTGYLHNPSHALQWHYIDHDGEEIPGPKRCIRDIGVCEGGRRAGAPCELPRVAESQGPWRRQACAWECKPECVLR